MTSSGRGTPAGLIYAAYEAVEMTPVRLPVDGQNLIAVVEPGHDPHEMWRQITSMMRREGIGEHGTADPTQDGEAT